MPVHKSQAAKLLSLLCASLLATLVGAAPSDEDPRIESWGEEWPEYVEMYLETRDMSKPTPFGGNVPYSKLIRFPGKTVLWAGYAFALDFNEERGHYYTQIDQLETKRNDQAFLNANGLPRFKGQPSACMNCHSGWAPQLIEEMGWETFNSTPYWATVDKLQAEHGHGTAGAELGSACADCHQPEDMSLRVTRRAYIDAMVKRGYEADPRAGLKGSAREMRDHVCQQCHVEYYFRGPDNVLTYPWDQWPKGEPLKIEMIEAYYEAERQRPEGFQADWTHAVTKAPMLKMQHPEAEVTSSGKHAAMVGCVGCHMPKIERNGKTVTDHAINSTLNKLDGCQRCHSNMTEEQIYQRVYKLQVRNVAALLSADTAILALIQDVATVRTELASRKPFSEIADESVREAAISEALATVLNFHRRASMRWDFIGASNSSGAHSPTEALRVLEQAVSLAGEGQRALKIIAADYGVDLVLTTEPEPPPAPAPIEPGNIVGSPPPPITRQADKDVQAYMER
ncbi:MAG: ammonia-forming cytochrome c nitrite reductase subunit c552 [Gammaproteobacteria bacterium]